MISLIARTASLEKTLARINDHLVQHRFAHVISLNPENVIEASHNHDFMQVYENAEVTIADGVGILWAAKILSIPCGGRITGVDLMRKLVSLHKDKKIVFVGGRHGTAQKTLETLALENNITNASWVALGDMDRNDPDIISHVIAEKPDLIFVAFGSPYQELWIEQNKIKMGSPICIGVGQGFDVISGKVARAPRLCRAMGFEWLYRLVTQPWRWKRQLRLVKFIYLVMRYRLAGR